MIFTNPQQARDAIEEALAYLVDEDGYQRDDLDTFLTNQLDNLYDND